MSRYIEFNFAGRLGELRVSKGVSARDMSLSLGQNPTYIHKIENGTALPSMMGFFYICEYLDIEPAEFFSQETVCPAKIKDLMEDAQNLTWEQIDHIHYVVKDLLKNRKQT